MANTHNNPGIDLQKINARNERARGIAAHCESAMPALADLWRRMDDALTDAVLLSALVSRLSAQVSRLSDQLDRARLERANLLAAMRAALAAHADGESDPLWYLRDELDAAESAADTPWGPR